MISIDVSSGGATVGKEQERVWVHGRQLFGDKVSAAMFG